MEANAGRISLDEDTIEKQTRLVDHLATSLKKTVPGSHAYTLYTLSTKLTPTVPLISSEASQDVEAKAPESTFLIRKILILVAEKIMLEPGKEVLVSGVEIHEYHDLVNESLTIYISKVDTTGCYSGLVTPTKYLLSAYMGFYSKFDDGNNRSLPKRKVVKFHLFARSQPQYLFHLSSKNPTKRVLQCSKLVRWWKNVLQQTFFDVDAQAKNPNNARGWFFIPGVTNERSARTLINDMVFGETEKRESQFWQYGYPYPDTQKAIHVIPRFEDDAKSRWLRRVGDSPTVKEFWDLVSHGGEFAGSQFAGFFWVEVKLNNYQQIMGTSEKQKHFENSIEKIGGLVVDVSAYNKALRELLDQNFQSKDMAIESTSVWNHYLTSLHEDTMPTDIMIDIVVENPMMEKEVKQQQVNVVPVNNLQMSIKRKATPSSDGVKTSIPPPLAKRTKDS